VRVRRWLGVGQASRSAGPASESSPLGDIPDDQVFVPYSPADGAFTVTVPEGWARTDLPDGASFTDKLNTVTVQQRSGRPQPTVDSVGTSELADVVAQSSNVVLGEVEARSLPVGDAVHATYAADATPDPVTGRVVTDDVELYVFWRNGSDMLLTLSGPQGADDVDAWHQVFDPLAVGRADLLSAQVHVGRDAPLPFDPAAAFIAEDGTARNTEVQLAGAGTVGDNLAATLGAAREDALYAQVPFSSSACPARCWRGC
jgi:hypothetical protein